MSKIHTNRIQIHLKSYPKLYDSFKEYQNQHDLNESTAGRKLINFALKKENLELDIDAKLNDVLLKLDAILHASVTSRVLSSEVLSLSESEIDQDQLANEIADLIKRYRAESL